MVTDVYDVEKVKRATAAWESECFKVVETLKVSVKMEKVKATFAEHNFGCNTDAVRALVGAILGEEIPDEPWSKSLPGGVMVVPLSKFNAHNYPIGQPVLTVEGGDNGLRIEDGQGNNLGCHWKKVGQLRPATPKEIDHFFAIVFSDQETHLSAIAGRLSGESKLMLHWLKKCSLPILGGAGHVPASISCMWSEGDCLVVSEAETLRLTESGEEVEQYLTETEALQGSETT